MRWLTSLSILLLAPPLHAQDRPLRTADPVTLPSGAIALEAGVDAFDGVSFPLSGLSGDLVRLPAVGFRLGMGGFGEFQGSAGHNLLFVESRGAGPFADKIESDSDVAHDIEDPVVAVKIRLHQESARWPATGLRVATRLPSAGQASGLGNDTMDFLLWILAAKTLAGTRVLVNGGLGILGVPEHGDSQNDVLVYGVAASRPLGDSWTVVGEVHGRHDTKDFTATGTEDLAEGRLGARWARGALALDGAVVVGLHEPDPDFGLSFGFTWLRLEAFQ